MRCNQVEMFAASCRIIYDQGVTLIVWQDLRDPYLKQRQDLAENVLAERAGGAWEARAQALRRHVYRAGAVVRMIFNIVYRVGANGAYVIGPATRRIRLASADDNDL